MMSPAGKLAKQHDGLRVYECVISSVPAGLTLLIPRYKPSPTVVS